MVSEVYGTDFRDHPSVMAINGDIISYFSFSPIDSTCGKQLLLDIEYQEVTRLRQHNTPRL